MKRSTIIYEAVGWLVSAFFAVYLASKGRLSWWVVAIAVPLGIVLGYFRYRYYLPFVGGARERRERRKRLEGLRAELQRDVGRQTRQP